MGKTNKKGYEMNVLGKQDLTISPESVKSAIPKYWERDYINSMIEAVKNHNHKMFLIFLWRSGVRVTEAVNLTKGKIDFNNYMMTVRWLKSRKYHERVVPIHPELRNLLQLYTASMKADDKIFPFSRQRAWQITKKYMCGHPHQFRHSFAVNWIRCGGDMIILHKVLGHSKIQTTMVYLEIVPIDQGKELLKIQF